MSALVAPAISTLRSNMSSSPMDSKKAEKEGSCHDTFFCAFPSYFCFTIL